MTDFKQKLVTPKYRIDNNIMRKYIHGMLLTKKMVDNEMDDVRTLLKNRYEKYGIIQEGANIAYLKTGNGYELVNGIDQSLVYIRKKIVEYKNAFAEEVFFWSEVDKDWNDLCRLLVDLNEIENFNLNNYLFELEQWLIEIDNVPKRGKKLHATLNSNLSDAVLNRVYEYVKELPYWASDNAGSRNFVRIFNATSVDDIKKIRLCNIRGVKAFVRALVEVLTNGFDAKIVNMCFCDEKGRPLNIGTHDRRSKMYYNLLLNLLEG